MRFIRMCSFTVALAFNADAERILITAGSFAVTSFAIRDLGVVPADTGLDERALNRGIYQFADPAQVTGAFGNPRALPQPIPEPMSLAPFIAGLIFCLIPMSLDRKRLRKPPVVPWLHASRPASFR